MALRFHNQRRTPPRIQYPEEIVVQLCTQDPQPGTSHARSTERTVAESLNGRYTQLDDDYLPLLSLPSEEQYDLDRTMHELSLRESGSLDALIPTAPRIRIAKGGKAKYANRKFYVNQNTKLPGDGYYGLKKAGGSSGLLMDLAANEKSVHADFFNDFEDLFDDEDLQ